MKESPASTVGTSVIIASEPQVFVSNLDAAIAFYVHKLGFKVVLSYGEPPFYAQIARDGGRLNLRRVSGPVFDGGFRFREADALSATLTLDYAEAALPGVSEGWSRVSPGIENGAVGHPHVHRARSGWKPHRVRRRLETLNRYFVSGGDEISSTMSRCRPPTGSSPLSLRLKPR